MFQILVKLTEGGNLRIEVEIIRTCCDYVPGGDSIDHSSVNWVESWCFEFRTVLLSFDNTPDFGFDCRCLICHQ